MKREERKIYTRCIAVMAVYIISAVYFYTTPTQARVEITEKGSYEDETVAVEEFTAEPVKVAKNPQIRENTPMSDMPCDNPEAFERWLETYEQETGEEEAEKPNINTDCREDVQTGIPTELPTEVETSVEVPPDPVEETVAVYSVDGITPDPELQRMLYEALDRHSISYFYEIAWVQCYQESKWNVYAVNPNNLIDSGILQFRSVYWDWNLGDILDPAVQFELYAEQMANRLNQGLSADECISRHITSDYCTEMDWQYVSDVKQHLPNLRKVN